MLAVGIDFGTTNSSAAVLRDGRIELVPLEDGEAILPSTVCITQEQQVLFGREAINHYLEIAGQIPIRYTFTDIAQNSEALSRNTRRDIWEAGGAVVATLADDDEGRPARLFQSLKTALRDPSFGGTVVFDRYYSVEELIALVLRHIRERVEAYVGQAVEGVLIGRPVSYAPRDMRMEQTAEEINQIAAERMLAAARLAGFTHGALMVEPVAASWHLRSLLNESDKALVFDFGGGTLDITVAEVHLGQPKIWAAQGCPLGGDDFDSAIMDHSLLAHFGKGTTLGDKALPFPPHLLAPLLHWQTMHLLASPANAARLARIRRTSNAPQTADNLQILVRQGLGFHLFRSIEGAKIALTEQLHARIRLQRSGLDIDADVSRSEFVHAISNELGLIERVVRETLDSTGMRADEIDAVLMTGGSSLVPVVQATMRRVFGDNVRVADPFTSISAGLALAAAAEPETLELLEDRVPAATAKRLAAEAVTLGEKVSFSLGDRDLEGIVVRRAQDRLHDATLIIEYWDPEIEEFVSTLKHETKVRRLESR